MRRGWKVVAAVVGFVFIGMAAGALGMAAC